MKRIIFSLIIILIAALCWISAEAAVTDDTVSVSASGSVTGSADITNVTPTTISYGTNATTDRFPADPADGKIVITYHSNYNPWKIMVYTNNTQVNDYNSTTKKGRYSKGGLVSGVGDDALIVPCKWVARDPVLAAPAVPSYPASPTDPYYNFVKDKRDQDDPSDDNPLTPEVENDSSWSAAFADGYSNVAYGTSSGGFCVNPLNTTSGHEYEGDPINGSVALYIAAGFGTSYATDSSGNPAPIPAAAGSYGTNFIIELYHE